MDLNLLVEPEFLRRGRSVLVLQFDPATAHAVGAGDEEGIVLGGPDRCADVCAEGCGMILLPEDFARAGAQAHDIGRAEDDELILTTQPVFWEGSAGVVWQIAAP